MMGDMETGCLEESPFCRQLAKIFFQKSEITMEVGRWVQVSLGIFSGKSSQNSPNPYFRVLVYLVYMCILSVQCTYIAKSCWLL